MSMTNDLKLDLINGYLTAAGDEQDADRIRYQRSVFIRDVLLVLWDADKRYGPLDDDDEANELASSELAKVVDQVHAYNLAVGNAVGPAATHH